MASTLFTESAGRRVGGRAGVVAGIAIAVLIGATGCQGASELREGGDAGSAEESTDTHFTRVKLYSSTDELASDSALVVIGTVGAQQVTDDIEEGLDFTVSTISVNSVLSDSAQEPTSVEVRQVGSVDQAPPTPLLEAGSVYLLYLAESGLEAPLDQQYYVTGGNAGLYKLEEQQLSARELDSIERGAVDTAELGSLTFVQVDPEEGEQLPTEVQSDQL